MACSSSGKPSPVFALIRMPPPIRGTSSSPGTRSHLLRTEITVPLLPNFASSLRVTSRCTCASELEASQMFSRISAAAACSSVEWNACTRWCGSLRTNPTVSISITVNPFGSFSARAVGSSVANNRFSVKTPAFVSAFIKVLFPTFV